MKCQFLALLSVLAMLGACAAPPKVGPPVNLKPAITSNAATRQHIKETRSKIKESEAQVDKTQSSLQQADQLLNQMLKQK